MVFIELLLNGNSCAVRSLQILSYLILSTICGSYVITTLNMGKWSHGGNLLRTTQLVAERSESRAISNNPERGEEIWPMSGGPGEGHGGDCPGSEIWRNHGWVTLEAFSK